MLPDRTARWTPQERPFSVLDARTAVVVAIAVVATLPIHAITSVWLATRLRLVEPEWSPDTAPAAGVAAPP
jgi:hypothetical protein